MLKVEHVATLTTCQIQVATLHYPKDVTLRQTECGGKRTIEGTRREEGVVRTKEVRKWDEEPSGEVEGNEGPHYRIYS